MPGHTRPESSQPTDDAHAETPTVEKVSSAAAMTADTDATESAATDSVGSAATSAAPARPAPADSEDETDWRAIVAEKDELIAALTERLEEAAEQLDRLKRTVGEHGLLVAGLPRPVIEQQQRLTSLLSDVLDAWTDPENSPWEDITRRLDRLDAAIRDGFETQKHLIGSLQQAAASTTSAASIAAERPHPANADASHEPVRDGAEVDGQGTPTVPGTRGPQTTSADSEPCDVAGVTDDAATPAHPNQPSAEEAIEAAFDHVGDLLDAATGEPANREDTARFDITQLSLPDPVADDETDIERLHAAVAERDRCIVALLRSLRQTLHPDRAISWRQILSGAAEDDPRLARIEELEQQLQQALRTAEIELSLERAQLAREKMRLQREMEQLQRTRSQSSQDADTPRWLRFLAGSKRR